MMASTKPLAAHASIFSRISTIESRTIARSASSWPALFTRSASRWPEVSLSSSRVSEMVRTAIFTGLIGWAVSMRPPGVSAFISRGLLVPAGAVGVVLGRGLDPACAAGPMLLLPEGRAGLQVVHQEVTGLEGGAAVAGGRGHEHDRLARRDPADAMQDRQVVQAEAGPGLLGDLADLGL